MRTDLQPRPREYRVRLKRPHAKQDAFIHDRVKRKVVRAGRRGGKTTGLAILAVLCLLAGRRVLYAAPTVDQVGRFWTEVKAALAELTQAGVYNKNESSHLIEHPGTEARIKAKTAWNADSLRGDYADVLILDEWQLMDEDAWGLVGAPMLLDNDGDAIFVYTPPSLRTRSVTKAKDPRHASKMFKAAALDKSGRWKTYHFTSHDNPHISSKALEEITLDMTALSHRQEILAEDIDEAPGALWKVADIERNRRSKAPEMVRVVVGVDPSGNRGIPGQGDEAGIVGAGKGEDGHGYTLADRSRMGSPKEWAEAAVRLYLELEADCIIAEKNNGGEMVRHTIQTVTVTDKNGKEVSGMDVPVRLVTATRGKQTRAEPVSVLMENGTDHHVGSLPKLEDEMTMWVPGAPSPNRMDAKVWAYYELFVGKGDVDISGGGERVDPRTREVEGQEMDATIAEAIRQKGLYWPGEG